MKNLKNGVYVTYSNYDSIDLLSWRIRSFKDGFEDGFVCTISLSGGISNQAYFHRGLMVDSGEHLNRCIDSVYANIINVYKLIRKTLDLSSIQDAGKVRLEDLEGVAQYVKGFKLNKEF